MVRVSCLIFFPLLRFAFAQDSIHALTERADLEDRGSILTGVGNTVGNVVDTVTATTAQLQVGACVRLKTAFDFAASTPNEEGAASIKLKAGACICVDANVYAGVLDASAGVDVVAQVQGQQSVHFKGDIARTIARSIQLPILYPGARAKFNFNIDPLSVCLSASAMLGFSEHHFLPKTEGNCCLRRCINGYIEQNGQCVPGCPPGFVRRPNGKCKPDCTPNQIECDGQCYNKNQYTCPSGIPVPKSKRSLDSPGSKQCGHGLTLCPVPWGAGWECLDTQNDIESCGGCLNAGAPSQIGIDCTALQHTNSVSCTRGTCRVHSCERGFAPTSNGTACEVTKGRKPHFQIQSGHTK